MWPPLPLTVYARRRREPLPFPLHEPNCRLYARARQAIFDNVGALGLHPGDEVLVPAYHHGSEIEALAAARLRCRFYGVDGALKPTEAELSSLVGPGTRAVLLIHYLGFPQDAPFWRRWCDEHGLALIEDAAQAWLGSIDGHAVGSFGHLSVFCMYKMVGIPDGSAAVLARSVVGDDAPRAPGFRPLLRRHAAWLLQQSAAFSALAARVDRKRSRADGNEFGGASHPTRPSRSTTLLLPRLRLHDLAEKRRKNYRFLLDQLREFVPAEFADLPEGACPFAFPIDVGDRAAMLGQLRREGVHALSFWSVPHPSLPPQTFPKVARLRSRLIALPVHQELSSTHLEQTVAVVRATKPRRRLATLET